MLASLDLGEFAGRRVWTNRWKCGEFGRGRVLRLTSLEVSRVSTLASLDVDDFERGRVCRWASLEKGEFGSWASLDVGEFASVRNWRWASLEVGKFGGGRNWR